MAECFWTDNQIVVEDCGGPPPTGWSGLGSNGFDVATSPNTIGQYSEAYDGYSLPPGLNAGVGFNSQIYVQSNDNFESEYVGQADSYTGTFENLRIVKMDSGNVVVDTFPLAGSFPITVIGQDEGLRNYGYTATFSGSMPTFDSDFRWGFIADLAMTSADPGALPVNVEIAGPYSFDVKTLVVVGAGQAECLFSGPVQNEELEYAGLTWVYTKFLACEETTDVDATYDGDAIIIPTYHTCT